MKNPKDQDARFDIASASYASSISVDSIQAIKDNTTLIGNSGIAKDKLPKNLYRSGSKLKWSNRAGYGFTDESKDLL